MTRVIAETILRVGRCGWPAVVMPLVLLTMLAAVGCDGGTVVTKPHDDSNLRSIIRVYGIAARDLGRAPKSMDELTAVYAQADPDPSKYVRSPRDGEEFVVVWDLNLETQRPDAVIAYERKGVDGKRMVVTADSNIREVTNDEFAQMRFPKNYKPEI